ncbi:class I SAM-dependent methyltransferase [Metabacillus sp. 84]|uniref:class I SAM-dependent methyltransferase n=1 Tax=unclassified Metabacillus TaxID=2675274 RepID=UPI003CE8AA1A
MIVTTVMRNFKEAEKTALRLAPSINGRFEPRNKQSIAFMLHKYQKPVLVVGTERMELFTSPDSKPFFFHPNSAMFRVKRLMKGQSDPFAQAAGLSSGKTMLDCTLGLASDSIIASFAVGAEGRVCGLENNQEMAVIVKEGLQNWDTGIDEINRAMRSVKVVHAHHTGFLKNCSDSSFDVVYFDPMFEEPIDSEGMTPLKQIALHEDLAEEAVFEALRVAKERVVLKDHWKSARFEKFGFIQLKRRSASFHYGVIELKK